MTHNATELTAMASRKSSASFGDSSKQGKKMKKNQMNKEEQQHSVDK